MRIIRLDAENWHNISDFFYDLRLALGAPAWHGSSEDAFIDSMIWGGINKVEPPYVVEVHNAKALPPDLLGNIRLLKQLISDARAEHKESTGEDVEVAIEIPEWPEKLTSAEVNEIDQQIRQSRPAPEMSAINHRITQAWIKASSDLGLKVIAPFRLEGSNGERYWYEAFIADFGKPEGTIVSNLQKGFQDERSQQGYYSSALSSSYEIYNRKLFIDTLNDWGWHGEKGKEPEWYTGQPWGSKTH